MIVNPLLTAIVGHLVGDFLVQYDSMAQNKSKNTWVCLAHVVSYTVTVHIFLALAGHWPLATSPLFAVLIAGPHFLVDRFALACLFMRYSGHENFATGPLTPWSIIVTDQVIHTVCLFLLVVFWELPGNTGGIL